MHETAQYKTVKTTVAAIITRHNGKNLQVLLTRRGIPPYKGQWCLPGGHIDRYETARDAIIREVKEEVGLDLTANFYAYFDEIIPEKNIHAVVLVFDGPASGELIAQPEEITELKWLTFPEAGKRKLAFQHNSILQAYEDTFLMRQDH
jgi:8-oxo-dGTP diphosphatase